jgi:hypothetical protein
MLVTIVELTDKVQISAGGENLANLIDGLFEAIGRMVYNQYRTTIKLVNKMKFEDLRTKFKTLLKGLNKGI